jgi:sugar phosphate isomerase/epimerase
VKLSLCNEVIRELPFERQCTLAAALGYGGLEVAPFTLGDDAWRMPAGRRAEVRRACSDAGIEVSGLHWLLAAPAGLSIATDDRTVWRRSVDVLLSSIELCADLGGAYLVHGSPGQRRVASPDDAKRVEEAWVAASAAAENAGVVYCLEPLARPDCNFVNTLAEAEAVVNRIGSPAFRLMVDTLASSLEEKEAVAEVIRRWMPTGLIGPCAVQRPQQARARRRDRDKFAPVVEALRDTGYTWLGRHGTVHLRARRFDLRGADDRLCPRSCWSKPHESEG